MNETLLNLLGCNYLRLRFQQHLNIGFYHSERFEIVLDLLNAQRTNVRELENAIHFLLLQGKVKLLIQTRKFLPCSLAW